MFRKVLKWGLIGLISFIGLVIVIVVVVAATSDSADDDGGEAQAPVPIVTAIPTITLAVTATPASMAAPVTTINCVEPEVPGLAALLLEMQSCKPDLSPDTKEVIRLFVELQKFKDDPEFHQVLFGRCCRFNDWKLEVDLLAERAELSTVNEIGIVPGDLYTLGWEYGRNSGRSTDLTEVVEADIEAAAKKTMGLATLQPTPTTNSALGVETIGEWEYEFLPGKMSHIKILSESGQLRVEETFYDGSSLQESLIEGQSEIGRRFDIVDRPDEYFVIDVSGNLQLWDRYGLVYTGIRIQ